MRDFRIALVQQESLCGRVRRNMEGTIAWARKAKKAGADLVCFPELNITGHAGHVAMVTHAELLYCPHTARFGKWSAQAKVRRQAVRERKAHWQKVHACRAWDNGVYVALADAVGRAARAHLLPAPDAATGDLWANHRADGIENRLASPVRAANGDISERACQGLSGHEFPQNETG